MWRTTTGLKRPSSGSGEPLLQQSSRVLWPTAFARSVPREGILTTMRRDIGRSPWGAAAFAATLLMLFFLTADRLGWFAPGPVISDMVMIGHIERGPAGDEFVFQVSGLKTTNDTLLSRSASWIFSDGTPLLAPIDTPTQANRVEGERFMSQVWRTPIPAAVDSDRGAVLRVCFGYDPGMSCVQKAFSDMEALP